MKNILGIVIIAMIFVAPANAQDFSSKEDVVAFALVAAREVMTFGFDNFEKRKTENKKYFSDAGYASFYTALDNVNMPQDIVKYMMISEATVTCFPEVVEAVAANGKKEWKVTLPLSITWLNGQKAKTDKQIITMTIANKPFDTDMVSLGIDQWMSIVEAEDKPFPCTTNDTKKLKILNLQHANAVYRETIEKNETQIKILKTEIGSD